MLNSRRNLSKNLQPHRYHAMSKPKTPRLEKWVQHPVVQNVCKTREQSVAGLKSQAGIQYAAKASRSQISYRIKCQKVRQLKDGIFKHKARSPREAPRGQR